MKKSVAIFRNSRGWDVVFEGDAFEDSVDYTRISDIIEVEFTERDPAERVPAEIASLNAAKEVAREEWLAKESELDERIRNLSALTHDSVIE
jgi:hypothetical protein